MDAILQAKGLHLAGAITNGLLVLMLVRQLWRRREPASAFWLAASASLMLSSLAAYIFGPGAVTLVLGGGTALLGFSFACAGVRLLRLPAAPWRNQLWLPLLVASLVVPAMAASPHVVGIGLYLIVCLVMALIVLREVWLMAHQSRFGAAYNLVFLALLMCAWTTYRLATMVMGEAGSYPFVGSIAAGILGPVFGMVALSAVQERQVLREAELEAAAQRRGRAEVERLHAGLPALIFLLQAEADGQQRTLYVGGDSVLVSGWSVARLYSLRDECAAATPGLPSRAEVIRTVLQTGACAYEWRTLRPDGKPQWLRSSFRLLKGNADGGGEIVGYIVNITAEREAAAQANIRARIIALGEMAAGLAHELRQPLGAIKLAAENAESALKRGDSANVRVRLQRTIEQAGRAADLIEHLHRFAEGAAEPAPLDLLLVDHVVRSALSLVSTRMAKAGIQVITELGDVPPLVMGREMALEQVLLHLLSNARYALEALPPDAPRWVRITAEQEAGRVRLLISDNGGGIPADILPRMFEPFSTTKGADEASGLGLAVSHGLMASMGGSIKGCNGPDGAVFTLELADASTALDGVSEEQ